jgi:hypothetical protein
MGPIIDDENELVWVFNAKLKPSQIGDDICNFKNSFNFNL